MSGLQPRPNKATDPHPTKPQLVIRVKHFFGQSLELGGDVPVGEDELGEGFADAGGELHFLHVVGECAGFAEGAERPDGGFGVVGGEVEVGADLVLVEAGHAVGVEAESNGLQAHIRRRGANVMQRPAVVGAAFLGKGRLGEGEDEHGSGAGPGLVELDEAVEDFGVGLVALVAEEEAPGLLVRGGRGPGGGGEDLGEVFVGDGLVREGARGPAAGDELVDAGGGGGVLEGFEVGGHGGLLLLLRRQSARRNV
jgi:hypothetical protein